MIVDLLAVHIELQNYATGIPSRLIHPFMFLGRKTSHVSNTTDGLDTSCSCREKKRYHMPILKDNKYASFHTTVKTSSC